MKMEITYERKNGLYGRTEACITVDHARESTPGRNAVAEELAKHYNTKRELVIVDELKSVYGVGKTQGYVKVYANVDDVKKYEPEYLQKRNGFGAKPAEESEE